MIYNLEPKTNALQSILGNIDQLDISYTLQTEYNTSYNTLLLCMNMSLLSILYKYDQYSPEYIVDQTDVGNMECMSFTMEFVSDNMVKFNIVQKFVRCFSFYKEQSVQCNGTCGSSGLSSDYISLYPKLFLDTESSELNSILTIDERKDLVKSKVLNVEYNTSGGHWLPVINNTASKGVSWPEYLNLFTMIDTNINYIKTDYMLVDNFTNLQQPIKVQYDEKPGEDIYSSYAKTFNIINDSTIIMEFEMYINIKQFKYLLDINDININYHINVNLNNTINSTGTYNIDLYESNVHNYFKINDVVYFKNIYTDTVSCVAKVLNVTGNTLSLLTLYTSLGSSYQIDNMDTFIINKVKNLENFNIVQNKNNFIRDMITNNLFVINDIEFTDDDYLAINNLG